MSFPDAKEVQSFQAVQIPPFDKKYTSWRFRLNYDDAPVMLKDREGYFSFHSLPFGLFTVSNMRDIFLEEPLCTPSIINNGK